MKSADTKEIGIKEVQWNNEKLTIVVRDASIALTPTEYRLLYSLHSGTPVTYLNLSMQVYHCAFDDKVRAMIDKHIDRIRAKLRGTGIYVYCIKGYGYLLLPEASD